MTEIIDKIVSEAVRVSVPEDNCPECHAPLQYDRGEMVCPNGHGTFGSADDDFEWNDYDFGSAGQQAKKVEQPILKWSYDGKSLTIWPVDEVQGRPHHIEVTGLQFYNLAQGRVYEDKSNGELEILIWEDRGTTQMQDEAIEAVDNYLKKKLGRGATYYGFQSEGGVYQKQDPNNPNMDEIMTAYFGYPVKTKQQDQFDPTLSEGI